MTEAAHDRSAPGVLQFASTGATLISNLILIAANLVPLIGVILWGWDAFLLLLLYWLETAVIAFWTIVRIALLPRGALAGIRMHGSDRTPSPFWFAVFVTLHAGIFMFVHFLFLWELFGGEWTHKVRGVGDFVDQVIVATGLWVPLIALFVGRGVTMMWDIVEPYLRRRLRLTPHSPGATAKLGPAETLLFGLYLRVIIMQVAILLGGLFALLLGSVGAYVFLVALKTAVDLAMQACADAFHVAWVKARAKAMAQDVA